MHANTLPSPDKWHHHHRGRRGRGAPCNIPHIQLNENVVTQNTRSYVNVQFVFTTPCESPCIQPKQACRQTKHKLASSSSCAREPENLFLFHSRSRFIAWHQDIDQFTRGGRKESVYPRTACRQLYSPGTWNRILTRVHVAMQCDNLAANVKRRYRVK